MSKTVLVVDDDLSVRSEFTRKLSMYGYHVELAQNGKEGLEKALSLRPALIVLDIMMPEINGMTVLKTLREDSWGKSVPVIILTNLDLETSSAMMAQIADYEPSNYYVKANTPVDQVIEKIEELLEGDSKPNEALPLD